jgi:hypothetical protein
MVCFNKWSEAYAIPSEGASTVPEVLVMDFSHCGITPELHSDI